MAAGEELTVEKLQEAFLQNRPGIPLDIVFEDEKYDAGRKVIE